MLHENQCVDSFGKVLFVKTGEHTSVIYGTHYPNRLFVGCLPEKAGAEDLGNFFSTYGNVVEAKVVLDQQGRSRNFGFVTFSNPEAVETLISGKEIYFKGKKINVGPAVKKNLDSEPTANPVPKPLKAPAMNAQQHLPKTIVRRSPAETSQMPYENHNEEGSFRSIWGITNQVSSIWAPLNEDPRNQNRHYQNAFAPTQEKSFSLFQQMQDNNNHGFFRPNNTDVRYSNAVRAPPGFHHSVMFNQK